CDDGLVANRSGAPGHHGVRGLHHLWSSDPPRHAMASSIQALTFTPSHDNSWLVDVRGHVTTSTHCPPCLVLSLPAPMRLHHSIDEESMAEEAQGAAMAMVYGVTVLGDVLQPLTGSNRAVPSTAVLWRAGFASRITGKRLGKEARGTMKRRG